VGGFFTPPQKFKKRGSKMKYKINRDFSLKGIKYRTGDITEIPAVSSVRLLKSGLVSEVKAAPKPKKKAKKGDD
jgi:hypothetical protein